MNWSNSTSLKMDVVKKLHSSVSCKHLDCNEPLHQTLIKTVWWNRCSVTNGAGHYVAAISQKQRYNNSRIPPSRLVFGRTTLSQCASEGFSQGRTWGHCWTCRGKRDGRSLRLVPKINKELGITLLTKSSQQKPKTGSNQDNVLSLMGSIYSKHSYKLPWILNGNKYLPLNL